MKDLINIKPKIRTKGFLDQHFIQIKNKNESNNIYSRIKNNFDSQSKLNIKDKIIINLLLKSYEKVRNNLVLDKKDFVLKKQEISEFNLLNDTDIIRYLLYRYKYNKYPELKILDDYPPCIQIEITSICNLRCVMCFQIDKSFSNKSHGFMGYMKFDLFKKIIDEIEGKIEAVTFASRGEPTLCPDLDKMLKYCENKFLSLKINTNATLFNEKLIHTLLSSDLQTIVLSIDEKNKENYEKIRVNAKFDKIMKNLELFKKIREKYYSKSKIQVRVSGVKINTEQNINDIANFYNKFADQVTLVNYNPWQSAYENEINEIKEVCTELYRRIFVWWDGKVNPCDYDYKSKLSKWNAYNDTISSIWLSNYYNNIRGFHKNGKRNKIEPCARCITV